MGAVQSAQERDENGEEGGGEEEEVDEEEEEETMHLESNAKKLEQSGNKILEQEPEILPCHPSASPLSPQLSSVGTPYLGPSIKVWDPYHVLSPTHLPENHTFAGGSMNPCNSFDLFEDVKTEVFLINHGECSMSLRPDLVGGRCPSATLTANGTRQARALAVFLNSQGVRFNAVYSSPLGRARRTAISVCQELSFAEDQIQSSDALTEMSQGQWEGRLGSEIYTPEIISLIEKTQPDFSAPSGESLRQVEFRMIEFLNNTVLKNPIKPRTGNSLHVETKGFSRQTSGFLSMNSQIRAHPVQDWSGLLHWDLLHRHRQGTRKKSRLQIVTTGDKETEDEFSPRDSNHGQNLEGNPGNVTCVGIFTHFISIKCLLMGLLGCSPMMAQRICIDDSATTVLQHSLRTVWQIKRVNDTSHLRLL